MAAVILMSFHDNRILLIWLLLLLSIVKFLPGNETPESLGILLGPEGGLESSEIEFARSLGYQGVSLGPRVLRTETAAVSALAIAQAAWGDW